jgi:hypothetical protein
MSNRYNMLVEKFEGKRPPGRIRRTWEDSTTVDLGEVKLEGVDWIRVAQDRDRWQAVMNTIMNLQVP